MNESEVKNCPKCKKSRKAIAEPKELIRIVKSRNEKVN